jgi:biotin transport system substrate-specific component
MIFIGIPLMANFNAGLGVLIGPSAGFIFGWLPKMLMIKLLIKANCNKFRMFIVMIIATIVDLVFGSIWLMIYSNTSLLSTFSTTMISFLPFGILKVLLAMIILKKIPIRILN